MHMDGKSTQEFSSSVHNYFTPSTHDGQSHIFVAIFQKTRLLSSVYLFSFTLVIHLVKDSPLYHH